MSEVKKFEQFKEKSPFVAEISAIVVMLLLIGGFYLIPKVTFTPMETEAPQIIIETIEIPETQQVQQSAPPKRPTVPVMSESEPRAPLRAGPG